MVVISNEEKRAQNVSTASLVPVDLVPANEKTTALDVDEKHERDIEAPDGGLWGWLRVLAAFLLFVITWGPAVSFGAFEAYYQTALLTGYSVSAIAWIGGTSTFLLVASGSVTGPLFDKGYMKHMMVAGVALLIFGIMMTSIATKYYQIILAQGVAFGLGSGLVCVPALGFVSSSFTTKRPYAVGLTTVGASIGGIIFPILFRQLQPKIGFPWTVRVIGFVQVGLGIIGLAILMQAPKKTSKPRKMFQLEAFREPPYACFTVGSFCQFLAYWIPLFFVTTYARSVLHMSEDLSFYCVSILNAGSVFGRITPMFVMRKTGSMPVVLASTCCAAVLLWIWIAIDNAAGFIVFCALFGVFTGTFIAANPVALTHPAMIPSMDVVGTRLGMNWGLGGIGTLVGTPIAGALADPSTGMFLHAQVFAAVIMTIAAMLMVVPMIAAMRMDRAKRQAEAPSHTVD